MALTRNSNQPDLWQAVLLRDRSFDADFVYAVKSTGIYCRPSCPSRRPKREHVEFFRVAQAAEQAGFRPCHRCLPNQLNGTSTARDVVEKVCQLINRDLDAKHSLAELSRISGYSPFHLQRTFKRVLGISPRQYADTRRVQRLKSQLKKGENVTTSTYEAGFTSSSRVYEDVGRRLGMTPAVYGRGGKGMDIRYTTTTCPLGRALVAETDRGVCAVQFGDSDQALLSSLRKEYPAARIERGDTHLSHRVKQVLSAITGRESRLDMPVDVLCTAFQRQVWEALRRIPAGETRSYGQVAADIGQPKAVRAVANACATNPVAVVVPCHRVVRGDGDLGGYRWGMERKRKLLEREQSSAIR
jgi:AraC family transcriptional regulator of adaptative response/methylated-DNA-[protein]-cysteine methyltransferase